MAKKYYRQYELQSERGATEGNIFTSSARVINQADLMQLSHTPFGEKITVEKTPIINLQSYHGISQQRDYIVEDGVYQIPTFNGTTRVVSQNAKHEVKITGANQTTRFESAQTGVYISGYWAESGSGLMMNQEVPEGVRVFWGYFDDLNGFGHMKDSTGLYIFVRSGGVDEYIGQTANQVNDTTVDKEGWNVDQADGSKQLRNASGLKLDTSRGWMYQQRFFHYGFGAINFYINYITPSGLESKLLVHTYEREGEILMENANLPLSTHVVSDNTYAGGDFSVYVGGRQMSILGIYTPLFRHSYMARRVNVPTTGWYPIVSARLRMDRAGIQSFVDSVSVSTDQNVEWGIFFNGILDNNTFIPPFNTADGTANEGETAMNFNWDATTLTGGLNVFGDVLEGGKNNEVFFSSDQDLQIAVPRDRIVTLGAKASSTNASVYGMLKVRQEF